MTQTTPAARKLYKTDVVVRIYEIVTTPDADGKAHEFTVSLSMPIAKARITDRDSDESFDEAYARAEKVMKRDNIRGALAGATFIREKLIPAAQAR